MADDGLTYAGKYRIKGQLGQGGTARIYLCHDAELNRDVAVKEPLTDRPGADPERISARFLREARINGMLQHPGIVPVYEMGSKPDGTRFYSMRPISGITMHEAMASLSSQTPEEAFRLRMGFLGNLIDVADALAYAHAQGVVHRDVKPGNILIGEFGETLLFDWGLAKRLGEPDHHEVFDEQPSRDAEESDTLMTRQGQVLGTPSYMAPEQVDPRMGEINARSDVYALGVILFILLTGEKPYKGSAAQIMEQKVVAVDPPSPASRGSFLPPELVAICEKAMARDPSRRFADASEFAEQLRAFRDGRLVSVYAYSRAELFRRFVARNKAVVIGAIAVAISIVCGLALATHYAIKAERAHQAAEKALTDVTAISDATAAMVIQAATEANSYFHALEEDLVAAAQRLAKDPTPKGATETVTDLASRHKDIDLFVAYDAGFKPIAIAPARPELLPQQLDALLNGWQSGLQYVTPLFRARNNTNAFAISALPDEKRSTPGIAAIMRIEGIPSEAFDFDPLKSPYQLWCMDEQGRIVYDEDPAQVGKMLFSDALYADFPELISLGERIAKQPRGLGYYRFRARDNGKVTQKIAAWETLHPISGVTWKLVITYPYRY